MNDGAAGEDLLTQATSHPKPQPKAGDAGRTSAKSVQTMCGTSELEKTECVYIIMQIYTSLVGHNGTTGHEC